MAVTILAGTETSIQNTDNNPRDMDPIAELEPDVAPLTVLSTRMGQKNAENPKIEWLENERMPRITSLSASATSTASAFGVSADIFRVGDVVRVGGGFAILVTATAAGAITGTKVGSTAQVSASNTATAGELFIVANANAEGATLREIKFPQLVTASNYCQIVRTPFGVTGTEQATTHYSGPERARLQRYHAIEHARDKEEMFFFGARDIQASTQRLCGGIKEFLATNVTNDSGGTTEAEWQTFLKTGFRFGSQNKVAFCSPTAISVLEGYARSNIKTSGTSDHGTVYGIKMSQYVSGQGTVDLCLHRNWNDSQQWGGYVFLVDMDAIKIRPLRESQLFENRQAPDYDGYRDEYLGEYSLEVQHERKHALLTGVA